MHMTPNFILGMSQQKLVSLLLKSVLVFVTSLVVVSAIAETTETDTAYIKSMTPYASWITEQFQSNESVAVVVPVVESETWEHRIRRLINKNMAKVGGFQSALANKQVRCLAENIYHESRGESLEGQIAVAKVTLNRLDEGYASTVCGVVKQRAESVCQFSWVCNETSAPQENRLWTQAVGVALVTINEANEVEDPTRGATHFYATHVKWQPGWVRVKDSVSRIGNHIFYRTKRKE